MVGRGTHTHARAIGIGLIAVTAISFVELAPPTASAGPGRPNILLIVPDDQRRDTLGMMPHVRRWFGRQGTRFANAYANTPLCCPSRATMLTGQYMHNHGIAGNRMEPEALASVQPRMAQTAFHEAGYRTGLVGKFLNAWPNRLDPTSFDRWATTPFVTFSGDEWNVDGSIETVRQNSTSYIGDRTLAFFDEAEGVDDTPWFALVGFMAMHMPATVEREYRDVDVPPFRPSPAVRERDRSDKPRYVRRTRPASRANIRHRRTPQLRSLVALDDQVGRIMRRLEALGELDDTLVIYVSDNGFMWGEHRLLGKSVPYHDSIAVPMLARWPGHVRKGAIDRRLVGIVDVARTITAAAGVQLPRAPDGINLLNENASRNRMLVEFQHFEGKIPSWNALLSRRSIFVEYVRPSRRVLAREYYNLRKDPFQLGNVLGDGRRDNDPDVRRLHRRLAAMTRCAGSTCPR